ncbi:hypothetical protein HHI36_020961 [Cryptolaemus montrouzieri]|uniref:Uncharacterized protein n=1 Tax=Cryptolaemus montrouzieri TaxID=559131 RepID=A0ABD2NCW1_9CUCU
MMQWIDLSSCNMDISKIKTESLDDEQSQDNQFINSEGKVELQALSKIHVKLNEQNTFIIKTEQPEECTELKELFYGEVEDSKNFIDKDRIKWDQDVFIDLKDSVKKEDSDLSTTQEEYQDVLKQIVKEDISDLDVAIKTINVFNVTFRRVEKLTSINTSITNILE